MDPRALHKLSYGMYLVCSSNGGKLSGQVANTVFQVTAEPQKIAVCLNKQNLTHEMVSSSNKFSVSVLSAETPMVFIGRFGFKSGRDTDKFKDTQYKTGSGGLPLVTENMVACFELSVVGRADVGTHTLFVGEVTEAEVLSDKEPMTYTYYRECLKGKSPKTAPTYVKGE